MLLTVFLVIPQKYYVEVGPETMARISKSSVFSSFSKRDKAPIYRHLKGILLAFES